MKSTQLQINHRDYCKITTEICNLDCLTLSAYGRERNIFVLDRHDFHFPLTYERTPSTYD